MQDKVCLIYQPAGIGDIFLCQKIGYHYKEKGYRIIWPVQKAFKYINEYMDNFEYPIESDNFDYKSHYRVHTPINTDSFVYIPLNYALALKPSHSFLDSKYKLVDIDYTDWCNYFTYKRNMKKEQELFDSLNITGDYVLLNNNYGSPPNYARKNIHIDGNKQVVEMTFIEGYTLFDWGMVLENAEEIYSVDTSINYVMEKLNIKSKRNELYSRYKTPDFSKIKHIYDNFKYKWNYNKEN